MKVIEHTGPTERRILSAMITDATVLGRIAAKWAPPGLFADPWSNQVGKWCVHYYKRYSKHPGRNIEGIFRSWASQGKDATVCGLIETFLQGLSSEYERNGDAPTPDFITDLANDLFERVRLEKLADEVKALTNLGKMDEAKGKVSSYRSVGIGAKGAVDFMQEPDAFVQAFERTNEPLITYPGALGQFWGNSLRRGGFIAFSAGEKYGKSALMLDMAYRACLQRRKVAHFIIGDMDQDEVLVRYAVRMAKTPDESPQNKWPYTINYPTKVIREKDRLEVETKPLEFSGPLTAKEAIEACERIKTEKIVSKDSYLRLVCRPIGSIGPLGIRAEIDTWGDWGVPSVVVVDYADNLEPPNTKVDKRDQINDTWAGLKRLSEDLHCLVVTATQTNREGYDRWVIDRRNISEDKRKLAHVTGMVGMNMTSDEKSKGVFRLNWIVRRKGFYVSTRCVTIAGCLALMNPCVCSCW